MGVGRWDAPGRSVTVVLIINEIIKDMEWTSVWAIFIELVPSIWKSGQKLLSGVGKMGGFDDMPDKYTFEECVGKVRILWVDDMFGDSADPFHQLVDEFVENHDYQIKCRSIARLAEAVGYHIVLCDFENVGEMAVDHTRSDASAYLGAFRKEYFDKELYFVSGLTSFKKADASAGFTCWTKFELSNGSDLDYRLRTAVMDYMNPRKYWKRAADNMSKYLGLEDAWIEKVKHAFVADYHRVCRKRLTDGVGETPALLKLAERQTDACRRKCLEKLIEYIRL